MKYKFKKKIMEHTCIKKKHNNFEGNRYFRSPNVKIHW